MLDGAGNSVDTHEVHEDEFGVFFVTGDSLNTHSIANGHSMILHARGSLFPTLVTGHHVCS